MAGAGTTLDVQWSVVQSVCAWDRVVLGWALGPVSLGCQGEGCDVLKIHQARGPDGLKPLKYLKIIFYSESDQTVAQIAQRGFTLEIVKTLLDRTLKNVSRGHGLDYFLPSTLTAHTPGHFVKYKLWGAESFLRISFMSLC